MGLMATCWSLLQCQQKEGRVALLPPKCMLTDNDSYM